MFAIFKNKQVSVEILLKQTNSDGEVGPSYNHEKLTPITATTFSDNILALLSPTSNPPPPPLLG
jgi:hypothetical protein